MQIEAVRGIMADGKFIQRGLPVEVTYKIKEHSQVSTITTIGVLSNEEWETWNPGGDIKSIRLDTSKPLHSSEVDIPYEDIVSICAIQVDENGNKIGLLSLLSC